MGETRLVFFFPKRPVRFVTKNVWPHGIFPKVGDENIFQNLAFFGA
jgi:hypothetical protein